MKDNRLKVIKIISRELSIPLSKISNDCGPGDFPKWDSIGHMQIILSLEREFDIEFSIDDVMNIENVGDIIRVMNGYLD